MLLLISDRKPYPSDEDSLPGRKTLLPRPTFNLPFKRLHTGSVLHRKFEQDQLLGVGPWSTLDSSNFDRGSHFGWGLGLASREDEVTRYGFMSIGLEVEVGTLGMVAIRPVISGG